MKIGNIDLGERPVMLAPMEDVTDLSFRTICREQGADMVYTEFVSADALIRNIQSTVRKLSIAPAERPAAIQIYGKEIDPMVEAAKIAEQAKLWLPGEKGGFKRCGCRATAQRAAHAQHHSGCGQCRQGARHCQDTPRLGSQQQAHR